MSKKLVILSGGLDSTILTHYIEQTFGASNVSAISFNYNQKQVLEIEKAQATAYLLGINHYIVNLKSISAMLSGVSANIQGSEIDVPNIKQVLGDPQPVTYVPYRNMMMISIAFSYAEAIGADEILSGLQVHDEYGYWDTTQEFIDRINNVSSLNRKHRIKLTCPFVNMTKRDEVVLAKHLEIIPYLEHTLTCYNPTESGFSCGRCPSCSERINAFRSLNIEDPIPYSIDINWKAA